MPERANLRPVEQLGLDEQTIDDPEITAALEERQKRLEHKGEVSKAYKEAHEAAAGLIQRLELPEGGAARVGRFRITRTSVAARSVNFTTDPTSRIRISLANAEAPAPKPVAPAVQEPIAHFRRDPE